MTTLGVHRQLSCKHPLAPFDELGQQRQPERILRSPPTS